MFERVLVQGQKYETFIDDWKRQFNFTCLLTMTSCEEILYKDLSF